MTGSQCQSATRDLAVGRLDDLGGLADCLVPDSGAGVGEGSFGGVEPGGHRGPLAQVKDGGCPRRLDRLRGQVRPVDEAASVQDLGAVLRGITLVIRVCGGGNGHVSVAGQGIWSVLKRGVLANLAVASFARLLRLSGTA